MRAWVIESFGGPEVFKQIEMDKPEPGPGEVRIKVAATSVNPVDYKIRSGAAEALCPPMPAILHGDVSGVVDAVGEGVTKFSEGDKVYGCVGGYGRTQGALADYVIADVWLIGHAPKSIPLEDAAALPLVTITAWEALKKAGIINLTNDYRVLIHGGTGGVGHVAIQIAKAQGVHVSTTVSSSQKAETAKRLGADEIINYREETVADYTDRLTDGKGFFAVIDTIGGDNVARCIEASSFNGKISCIQGRTQIDGGLLHAKGLSLHLVFMLIPLLHNVGRAAHGRLLRHTAGLVDDGELKPLIDDNRFTFDQIGDAHAYAESGKQIGKVLVVHPDHA